MLSAIYHTALATTLILIRPSVRRDLQTFVSSITQRRQCGTRAGEEET